MNEMYFCNKCGDNYTATSIENLRKKRCPTCKEGKLIPTGIDIAEANRTVDAEYEKRGIKIGNRPYVHYCEVMRELYYYGKYDKRMSKSAIEKRDYHYSPAGIAERDRNDERWEEIKDNFIRCPNCRSYSIRKMLVLERIGHFGFLNTVLEKDHRKNICGRCGYKF